jgi:ankyrin repeat protein
MSTIPKRSLNDQLWQAAENGNLAGVKELLAQGANANYDANIDRTPLHNAAECGIREYLDNYIKIVTLLIDHGADVNVRDDIGETPLHKAIQFGGSIEIVKILISRGADVNIEDDYGYTPLDYARGCKSIKEVAELLIAHGADIKGHDKNRNTPPLTYEHGKLIITIKPTRELSVLHNAFLKAVGEGNNEQVRQLMADGAKINCKDASGTTPLHVATDKKIAEILITHGATINARNAHGSTPLHEAAAEGNFEIVALLIAHGADVNCRDKDGDTPLDLAQERGNGEIVALLKGYIDKQ